MVKLSFSLAILCIALACVSGASMSSGVRKYKVDFMLPSLGPIGPIEPGTSGAMMDSIPTDAQGSATIEWDYEKKSIMATLDFSGLDTSVDPIIGMHFHTGDAYMNGPINTVFCGHHPLPLDGTTDCAQTSGHTYKGNVFDPATWEDLDKLLTNDPENHIYLNIHTVYSLSFWKSYHQGPLGLIRGQVQKMY
eukprot:Nk52_evm24s967 gene=Nk52_evmTU24s967